MAGKNYDIIAQVYDYLGQIYSGGQIHAAKNSQLDQMQPGDRVLYVGVGPGEDAVLAAERGVRLTCLDLSQQMLKQSRRRIERAGHTAEFVQQDVLAHDRIGYYDVVVVNFFLNVFAEQPMRDMLAYVARLARPGGKVLISDFAAPRGPAVARWVQEAYWGVTDLFYWLLGLCAWHPIYDYPSYFSEAGLELADEKRFRPYRVGPGGFAAITAVRM